MGIDEVVEASDEELTKDAVASDLSGMNGPDKIKNSPASRLLSNYKILIHKLDPVTHRSDLSYERAVMLFKLETKVGLDLIKLIYERIVYEGPMRAK